MSLSVEDFEVYKVVLGVCVRYQVDINYPEYFDQLLTEYDGSIDDLSAWLEIKIPSLFRAVDQRPVWIQSPNWPLSESGEPMIFLGQFEIKAQKNDPAHKYFHDDTGVYVFMAPRGAEKTVIIQQY